MNYREKLTIPISTRQCLYNLHCVEIIDLFYIKKTKNHYFFISAVTYAYRICY